MIDQFGRTGFLLLFALAFPLLPLMMSVMLGMLRIRPNRPDPIKEATYECGVETEGDACGQFNVRYYVYAMIFVIFDVEVVFLYPLAVAFPHLGTSAFVAGAIFLVILIVGFAYDWARKALEWR